MKLKPFFPLALLCLSQGVFSQINSGSFLSKVDFPTGANTLPTDLYVGDLDGDNKPDVATANNWGNNIGVFRNQTLPGFINNLSLGAPANFSSGNSPTAITGDDIDGDGKVDLLVANYGTNNISIFRNTSTSGTVSFATRVDYTVGAGSGPIITADLNGDGVKEIVNSNFGGNFISIHRNLSTPGTIALQTPRVDIAVTGTQANQTRELIADDLDGDGKIDLAVVCYSGFVALFRNTSTLSTISFAPSINLTGINLNAGISCGDIDFDGKKDLVVSSYNTGVLLVYKNNSTSGTFNFATAVSIAVGATNTQPHGTILADLDNDNRLDIMVCRRASDTISVFRNFTAQGVINANTFSNRVNFATGDEPVMAKLADLDGDNKPELITVNYFSNNVSILKNAVRPSNGLIAWYPFNGNAGDSSGFGNHGTVFGATLTTDRNGNPGSAYLFNGSSHEITAPLNASLRPVNRITIATWIRPQVKATGGWNILVSYRNSNTAAPFNSYAIGAFAGLPNSNRWSYSLSSNINFADNELRSRNPKMDNVWHHLATVYDGSQMMIYINGVLDTAVNANLGNFVYNNVFFSIGNYSPSPNHNYVGSIDDLRIYDRALSLNEIRNLAGLDTTTIYYSKATGNLNQLSTWGTNTDGTGSSPLSFDSTRVIYRVQNNSSPAVGGTWRLGANSTVVFGDGTNSFNLPIATNDTVMVDSVFIQSNITLSVSGHLSFNKLNASSSTTVQFIRATTNQLIPGGTYENLVVSGGAKLLNGNVTIRNVFGMLTSITTQGNNLTLGTSTTNRGTLNRTGGTIIGRFTRWFNNTTNSGTTGLFPVGTATRYTPITIEYTAAPTLGGTLSAEFISGVPGNIGLPLFDFTSAPVFIDKTAQEGVWRMAASGVSGGTFTASVTANNFAGVLDFTQLRLIRRSLNGAWNNPGLSGTNTGTNAAAVVIRTGLNAIDGEFTVSGEVAINPLPVKWGTIDVKKSAADYATLTWSTTQEMNANQFLVERSLDGKNWEQRGVVKAKGNSLVLNQYAFNDDIKGLSGIILYRIKQVDFNQSYTYSKSVKLHATVQSDIQSKLVVYPNPSTGMITVEGLTGSAYLFDVTGKMVKEINQNGAVNISDIPNGLYFLRSGEQVLKLNKH